MGLYQLRKKIDRIDSDILKLLNIRAQISKRIAELKSKAGEGLYAPDRERQIYSRLIKKNKGPLTDGSIKAIYREIMSGSISINRIPRIAYLGPQDSFTHLAALKKFGASVKYRDCASITEVFAEVEKSRADYGVVPIENSIEGAVNHTLDMFVDSELVICSEILLNVSHNLLANCTLNKVRKVYSNSQVFGQCRQYLDTNLTNVELVGVSSTSRAALLASKESNSAAIASNLAAAHYGLKILAESIEDVSSNVTRFLVLGKTYAGKTDTDKTSIMFSIKDRVGALHDMLVPFKRYGINLTKIESRPSKRKVWEYYFFVDMIGHSQDRDVKKALEELSKRCIFLKILGSYPAA